MSIFGIDKCSKCNGNAELDFNENCAIVNIETTTDNGIDADIEVMLWCNNCEDYELVSIPVHIVMRK